MRNPPIRKSSCTDEICRDLTKQIQKLSLLAPDFGLVSHVLNMKREIVRSVVLSRCGLSWLC